MNDDLYEKAKRWMTENPRAMQLFRHYALELAKLKRPFGIALIAERVRWKMFVERRANEEFAINNSYRAYVARQLITDHPHLQNFLETRVVNHGPTAFQPGKNRRAA